ncbi:Kelch motif/Galactose oxidase, central domain containing protein [Novymonas esmeraldas]|uniref:Kelch motif/Galactose oxidase, central domain containing protein n=1 Tax=Novymonas esmeraldas TaxID=1808958 RepID=A0AAW0ENL9_9TRYP
MDARLDRFPSSMAALATPPSAVLAMGSSAVTRRSRSSSFSMMNEPHTLSFPTSSEEGSSKRSSRTKHGVAIAASATAAAPGAAGEVRVAQGCRKCIHDECQEEERQYFLRQQCLQRLSWVRVGGSVAAATGSFEEVAAHSLRVSYSLTSAAAASPAAAVRRGGLHGVTGDDAVVPPARFGHTAVLYRDTHILIFGGKAAEERYFNDVYQYDAIARRWSCVLADGDNDDGGGGEAVSAGAGHRGSASASYVSAPPASPSFSSPAHSRHGPARWAAAPATANIADVGIASAPLGPQHRAARLAGGGETSTGYDSSAAAHRPIAEPGAVTASLGTRNSVSLSTASAVRRRRPAGRVGHAAALYHDTMYILSGEQHGRYFDDMWALDVSSTTWHKEGGLPFSPRKGHTMHLLPADCTSTRARQDMLVVFGGLVKASRVQPRPADPELPPRLPGDSDFAAVPTNAVLLYYPTQRRWRQLTTCGDTPSPRFYHVSQLITGTALLLVFGGRAAPPTPMVDTAAAAAGAENTFLNDLRILDVSTGLWRHIRDVVGEVPSPRMCAASVFVNGTFGVFAGGGDTYCEDAFEFSLQHRRWRRLTPDDQPACSRPTVTYMKDRLIFFGGFAPRRGVLDSTMELCLAPLSLKNQCLLWWNRCAFDKVTRSSTRSRIADAEERAAAAAAAASMECSMGSGRCGGQVTLHCSPTATAHSSPVATPRSWYVNRGVRRPAPLRMSAADNGGAALATVPTAVWGTRPPQGPMGPATAADAPPLSPAPSYSPSSPAVFSPFAGATPLMSAWQEAGGSPSYTAPPPAQSSFPSHPSTVAGASRSPSQAGSPGTSSASYANAWPRVAATSTYSAAAAAAAGSAAYSGGGGGGGNNSGYSYNNNNSSSGGGAGGSGGGGDAARRYSALFAVSSASLTSLASSPYHASAYRLPVTGMGGLPQPLSAGAAGQHPAPPCFLRGCANHLVSYAAASLPNFAGCRIDNVPAFPPHAVVPPPPPTAPAHAAPLAPSHHRAGERGRPSTAGCSFSSRMQSPASPVQPRPVRVDVAPLGFTMSPRSASDLVTGAERHRQSPPYVRRANSSIVHGGGGSTFVSPQQHPLHALWQQPSQLQLQHQHQHQHQQRQTSTQFTESASSRASSVHSARSASAVSTAHHANAAAARVIERLEGESGPYLLRALASTLKRHEAAMAEWSPEKHGV